MKYLRLSEESLDKCVEMEKEEGYGGGRGGRGYQGRGAGRG